MLCCSRCAEVPGCWPAGCSPAHSTAAARAWAKVATKSGCCGGANHTDGPLAACQWATPCMRSDSTKCKAHPRHRSVAKVKGRAVQGFFHSVRVPEFKADWLAILGDSTPATTSAVRPIIHPSLLEGLLNVKEKGNGNRERPQFFRTVPRRPAFTR